MSPRSETSSDRLDRQAAPRRPVSGGYEIATDPFDLLRQKFLTRCRDQLIALKEATHCLDVVARSDGTLLRTAHSLAGGGGTFGFPELSEHASRLETLLSGEAEADPSEVRAGLDALVLELERILE